jgi:hypothetical protein
MSARSIVFVTMWGGMAVSRAGMTVHRRDAATGRT